MEDLGLGVERNVKEAKWQRSPFLPLLSLPAFPFLSFFLTILYSVFILDFASRALQGRTKWGHGGHPISRLASY